MNITYPGLYCKLLTEKQKSEYREINNPLYPEGFSRTEFKFGTGLGLLYTSAFEPDERETFRYKDKTVEFIDYWPTDKEGNPLNVIRACYTEQIRIGAWDYFILNIHISDIDIEEIKDLEVWNYISDEEKKKLETNAYKDLKKSIDKSNGKSNNVGRKRNPEYSQLPRELICSTRGCSEKLKYISPTMLIKKASESNKSIEEYVASWKCSTCVPKRRGRAPNPKWIGKPKELTCACGEVTKQHPSMTDKLAKEVGISFDEYVASYQCRKCRPATTTTTTTRGRKMSPDSPWYGLAKEVVCTCGKVQKQHASITDAQAKKAGKTFDEYVASWQCMKCRPAGEKRVRNGKKANPAFANIPPETACTNCSKVVKLVPANIVEKAEILGVTVEELVANYKCRSCGGRITKKQKE